MILKFRRKKPALNWYGVAHEILVNCRELADRLAWEGPGMYLTDHDWAILEGLDVILERTSAGEFLALRHAASLDDRRFDPLHSLYLSKKARAA